MIGDGQFFRYVSSGMVLGAIWALTGEGGSGGNNAVADPSMRLNVPTYPVRASSNNRYLVDQNDQPFMIVGDSPHSLIGIGCGILHGEPATVWCQYALGRAAM